MDKIEYKIGDRIIWKDLFFGEIIKASIDVARTNNRYLILFYDRQSVNGNNIESWEGYEDIKLDITYYRDLKIKQILDEI